MRSLVLVSLFLTLDAVAQIGVGIYLPAGRRTQRIGAVPDSLALYSAKEIDFEPRHAQGIERWTERIARMEECPIDTALYQCEAEGVVVLRFTVERDGAITDAQVVKGGRVLSVVVRHEEAPCARARAIDVAGVGGTHRTLGPKAGSVRITRYVKRFHINFTCRHESAERGERGCLKLHRWGQ